MKDKSNHIIITGGAGFIGSHLVENLEKCTVLDNLSTGTKYNLKTTAQNKNVSFKKCDITTTSLSPYIKNGSTVFHLAASSDVKDSMINPTKYFKNNTVATMNLLEAMRKKDAKNIIFASSSVVYGNSSRINFEDSPKNPISIYGLTKLMCESAIETYCNTYGFRGVILRLANIVGVRAPKGIIHDIVSKFQKNPKKITVLGNGNQTKSYLRVSDCIDAMLICHNSLKHQKNPCEVYNVANADYIKVKDVVKCIADEMNISNFKIKYESHDNTGAGWHGDLPISKLSITKIKKIGWTPHHSCKEDIQSTVNQIFHNKN